MMMYYTPDPKLEITNGEGAECIILSGFLSWMKSESTPVPQTDEECSKLLNRWIKVNREEFMHQFRLKKRGSK